jgi:hypothetical protein
MPSSLSTILARGVSAGVLTFSAAACDSSTLLDGQGDPTAAAAHAQASARRHRRCGSDCRQHERAALALRRPNLQARRIR